MTLPPASEHEAQLRWRYRLRQAIGPLIALAAFALAAGLLYRELHQYRLSDILDNLAGISPWRVLAASLLTIASYVVLIGYDYLAVRFLKYPISRARIALVSFIGHVSSFNFGAVLGGTSVRYRLYSAWGLSALDIIKVITLSTATFWSGYLLLAGIVFLIDPVTLPEQYRFGFTDVAPIGAILLALSVAYLLLCAFWRKPLQFRGWELPVPSLSVAFGQMLISAVDLALAGAALYVLLPPSLDVSYAYVLAVYLVAVIVVMFTHVPGGLGIFEVVILLLLAPSNRAAVLGSLLVYRAIYYLFPLLTAAVLLIAHELMLRREAVQWMAGAMGRWAPAVAPRFLSYLVLIAGSVLLFSSALPARVGWLSLHLPALMIEASHFMNTIAGVVLLLLAYALQRRLRSAYRASVVALASGILFSILKGFDIVEAAVCAAVLGALVPCRSYFYRRTSLLDERYTPEWMAAVVAVLLAAAWLGLFALKQIDNPDEWWNQFAREDPARVLRAAVGVVTVLVLIGMAYLLHHPTPKPHRPAADEMQTVRAIADASPRASAQLARGGDKYVLFNPARTAYVMYAVEGRSWVSLGDPVGPARELPELIWNFRELAEHYGGWPVFYQASAELLPTYLDLGMTLLKFGDEARVPLSDFRLEGAYRQSLRQVIARAEQLDYSFELVHAERVASLWPTLEEIAERWQRARPTRECRFDEGCFDRRYLEDFPLAVARRRDQIVAFGSLWRAGEREELALDLLRYRPEAAMLAQDYLQVQTMLWGRQHGYRWFNLGLAPLASAEEREIAINASRLGKLVNHYIQHLFPQPGLRQAKEKFRPVWTTKYLAAPGGHMLPEILADIGQLISGTRPHPPARAA